MEINKVLIHNSLIVLCNSGGFRWPAGEQKWHKVGPGGGRVVWQWLCWTGFPWSECPSVTVSVVDQQPDHQQPAGLYQLHGDRVKLWNRSCGFPFCNRAAVCCTGSPLSLCPLIGWRLLYQCRLNMTFFIWVEPSLEMNYPVLFDEGEKLPERNQEPFVAYSI